MNAYDFDRYYEAMNCVKAEELLFQLKAHDWPNMKQGARGDFHRKLYKAANPVISDNKKVSKGEDMARMIKGLIGGR